MLLPELPTEAFSDILSELQRKPLPVNSYRKRAGEGRSQSFGIVNRRSLPPDYSRQNWLRPKLYKLLLEFADKHVTIPYTSITVNQNYKAAAHRDRGNEGVSYLVACGNYTGGELKMLEGDLSGSYNVNCRPIVADFSKVLHEVQEFNGVRVSLVFYKLKNAPQLPPPSVEMIDGVWRFKRGEEIITSGLPHPLIGKRKGVVKEEKEVVVEFP